MRRLTPSDYLRMPWRNGGGTTTEILVEPAGANLAGARFHYRVSIADITSDGPFSRFDGYDRHIMLLAGSGMKLDCGSHGSIDVIAPFEPRAFSGDWDVRGSLIAGPSRDFNLIVDRARATSSLRVRVVDAPETLTTGARAVSIIHVISGSCSGAEEGDTLVAEESLDLVPRGATRIAIAQISRR